MDQITVALDGAGDLLAEVGGAIEGVLNGLHGEVSVAAIDYLKDKKYPSFRNIYEVVFHYKYILPFIIRAVVTSKGLDYNLSQLHCCSRPITI